MTQIISFSLFFFIFRSLFCRKTSRCINAWVSLIHTYLCFTKWLDRKLTSVFLFTIVIIVFRFKVKHGFNQPNFWLDVTSWNQGSNVIISGLSHANWSRNYFNMRNLVWDIFKNEKQCSLLVRKTWICHQAIIVVFNRNFHTSSFLFFSVAISGLHVFK